MIKSREGHCYRSGFTIQKGNPMDKIILKGMKFFAYHGVTDEERRNGQEFKIDLEIAADTRAAAKKDSLELTIDYSNVYQKVASIVNGERVKLIETLAAKIADDLLALSFAESVTVRVKKTHPPIDGELKWAAVEITRKL